MSDPGDVPMADARMPDEQRAEWLARLLAGDVGASGSTSSRGDAPRLHLPDGDDTELAELARLGEDLQRLGPSMAALARAEQAFDPAFAQRLKQQVLADHPAAVHDIRVGARGSAPSGTPDAKAAHERHRGEPPRSRSPLGALRARLRVAVALATLAVVAIVAAVLLALNAGSDRQVQVAQQLGHRPTATGIAASALHAHAALTRQTSPVAPTSAGCGAPPCPPAAPHTPAMPSGQFGVQSSGATPLPPQPAPGPHLQRAAKITPSAAPRAQSGPARAIPPGSAPPATPMQPFAAVAPGSGTVTPAASGEMHADAAVPGALRYQLPAHIAALPSTAPVYALRYDALSRQTLHAIVDRFPSFRAARPQSEVVGGRTMLVYTHGTERLGVVLSTGEVFYTAGAGAPASRTELPPAAALIDAHTWLTAHGLYPSGMAAQVTQSVPSGAIMRVQYVPSALIPAGARSSSPRAVPPDALAPADAAIDLSVDLDAAGRVVAAHRLWPRLIDSGRQPLLGVAEAVNAECKGAPPCTPSQATVQGPSRTPGSAPAVGSRGSAPTRGSAPSHGDTPTFIVDSVTLVYRVTGSVPNAHLRPSYLLRGHLSAPAGDARTPVRLYTELIAAEGR